VLTVTDTEPRAAIKDNNMGQAPLLYCPETARVPPPDQVAGVTFSK